MSPLIGGHRPQLRRGAGARGHDGRRPKVEQAAQAVFSREGFTTKRVPTEHAGGKWRLSYQSYTGQSGNLEVDLNFMFRLRYGIFTSPIPTRSAIFRPGISLCLTCMSWRPVNWRHCWHAARQGFVRLSPNFHDEGDRQRTPPYLFRRLWRNEPQGLENYFNRRCKL